MNYSIACPVQFGSGAISQLSNVLGGLGCKHVMFVTDNFVSSQSWYADCKTKLEQANIKVSQYNQCLPDPPDYTIVEIAKQARELMVDGLVAIGGGSVMDAAKGANILINNPGTPADYYFVPPENQKQGFPLVCIPTTAGTGSESTMYSIITDTKNNEKNVLIHPATVAIVDPELTLTAPPSVTANTGMDIFAHSIEAVTAGMRNPYSEALALDSIRRVVKYLPIAVATGSDIEARENLAAASNLAGIAFNSSSTHIGHGIAHVLGVKYHIPHGIGCAMASPETLRWTAEFLPREVKLIGEAMGLTFKGSEDNAEIGKKVADAVLELMAKVGIPPLSKFCKSEEEAVSISGMILADPNVSRCPIPIDLRTIKEIMARIYSAQR
ncbi:iron-containing alcohol dehydrogenase [Tepidibacter sp. Z1-5]|uniref:iron-containing alcohol dehydrogenase n=1 Tax=Tepidibacter sp. Z1-5 TaxID=3134138 RepID=UPI0030BC15C5